MREAGTWSDPSPSPPSFDDVAAFASTAEDDVNPVPGGFAIRNSFSRPAEPLPQSTMSIGDGVFQSLMDAISEVIKVTGHSQPELLAVGFSHEKLCTRLASVACVALAVHLAKTHSNMGFGSTTLSGFQDPPLPTSVSDYIQMFGEFSGPDGRRWLLADFPSTVASLVRAAYNVEHGGDPALMFSQMWLPACVDDARTCHILATRLSVWFSNHGFQFRVSELRGSVLSGEVPPQVSACLSSLSLSDREVVLRLFEAYSTDQMFLDKFTDRIGVRTLFEMGLVWDDPVLQDLSFSFPLARFSNRLVNNWRLCAPALQSALGSSFSHAAYPRRFGSKMQIAVVKGEETVYTVRSFYALSEAEKTQLCCFGNPVVFCDVPTRYSSGGCVDVPSLLPSLVEYDLGI